MESFRLQKTSKVIESHHEIVGSKQPKGGRDSTS